MMQLKCIKTGETFPFQLNFFNNSKANSEKFSNIILEWWYKVEWFKSLVPFKKLYISYWAKDTPLIEKKELNKILWFSDIKIKDEWYNPFWTHKDRRSEYIINTAIDQQVDKIACLTAGNAWYSLSRYCARANIDYTSFIFPRVSTERRETLWTWWNVVIIDWNRNAGILRYRWFLDIIKEYDKYERWLEWNKIRSVTNWFEPISTNAYKELFYEIKDENPDYIVVPCGSWDIIIWIWLAIKELWLKTKIIWVWPKDEHPLKNALKLWIDEYEIADYKEKSIAEKLTSPFTWVIPILYKIFNEPWNIYKEVDNDDIIRAKEIVEKFDIKLENSAVPSFAVFLSNNKLNISKESKIIVVSTGKWVEN